MLTNQQKMRVEANAVNDTFAGAMADLAERGGDVRFFAACMLAAALKLHVEIEGPEGLQRAVSRLAVAEGGGAN